MNYQQTFDDLWTKATQAAVRTREEANEAAKALGLEDWITPAENELTDQGRVGANRDQGARTPAAGPVEATDSDIRGGRRGDRADLASIQAQTRAKQPTAEMVDQRNVLRRGGAETTSPYGFMDDGVTNPRIETTLPLETTVEVEKTQSMPTARGATAVPDVTAGGRTARGVSGRAAADLGPDRPDLEDTRTADGRTTNDRTARGVSGHAAADLGPSRPDLEYTTNDRTDPMPSRSELRKKVADAAARHNLDRELAALSKVEFDDVTGTLEKLARDARKLDPKAALSAVMSSPAAKTFKKFLGPAGTVLSAAVIGDILSDIGASAQKGDLGAVGTGTEALAEELNPIPGVSVSDAGRRLSAHYGGGDKPSSHDYAARAKAAETTDRALSHIKAKKIASDRAAETADRDILADDLTFQDREVEVETPAEKKPTAKKGQPGLLAMGAVGSDVAQLQKDLQALGALTGGISADEQGGIFGAQTKRAVEAFQRREGLTVDGMFGPDTKDALMVAIDRNNYIQTLPYPEGRRALEDVYRAYTERIRNRS